VFATKNNGQKNGFFQILRENNSPIEFLNLFSILEVLQAQAADPTSPKPVVLAVVSKMAGFLTPETLLTFSLMFQLAVASSNIGKIRFTHKL
jgi:hypothetical protein